MRIVWGYKTECPEPHMILIDGCQYANWSEKIFREMSAAGVSAVHVTICYHEDFRETVENMADWNRMFERFPDLIVPGRTAEDVRRAHADGRTAIVFGFQNCSPIEDDIGLVEICHQLGVRFMQLTYNNQSLLATGCYEENDTGVTRMGRQVIAEMNRVGLVVDMSHSGERSTLEAIEISERPIAITHANQDMIANQAKAIKIMQAEIAELKSQGRIKFTVLKKSDFWSTTTNTIAPAANASA